MATTGEWGGLQIRFEIPEITDAVSMVNGIFDLVITALDIALSVLSIIKSFTPSLLNPIQAIIQELIAVLQKLSLDFRKAGFYVHGDWYLLDDSTRNQLLGGYAGYQNRMLARLMDRTDLQRPTFSPSTSVLALFLYVGVDVSFVDGVRGVTVPGGLPDFAQFDLLNQLVSGFATFFGFSINANPLPTPGGLQANFVGGSTRLPTGGSSESSVATFRAALSRTLGRTSTILQWGLSPSPGTNTTVPSPLVPPDGFLVEVSCFPEGLYVGYLAPIEGSTGGVDGVPSVGSSETPSSYSTGLYLEGDTGRPLQIFGGRESIKFSPIVNWKDSFEASGSLKQGAKPIFFLQNLDSTQLIHTNVFDGPAGDSRFFNGRTFYISHEEVISQSLVGGTYSFELLADDLPWITPFLPDGTPDFGNARNPQSVYVRVLSVSNKVTSASGFRWNIVQKTTPESVNIVPDNANGQVSADRSLASSAVSVSFPTPEADTYLQALNTALAVMVLSRSDVLLPSVNLNPALKSSYTELVTSSYGEEVTRRSTYHETGLETFAQNLLPIFGDIEDYFTTSATPMSFGSDLRTKIAVLADQIFEHQGNLPQSVLELRSSAFNELIQWTWSKTNTAGASGLESLNLSILESLTVTDPEGNPHTMYVAKNPTCFEGLSTEPTRSKGIARDLGVIASYKTNPPGFGWGVLGIETRLQLQSPVVVPRQTGNITPTRAWYARELFTPEVYRLSATVLGLAAGESTAAGGWIAIRPFQSIGNLSGLPDVTTFIQDFLETIAAGLQGGADLILSFISMLEQRVREIQEILRRIRAYLSIPLSITIPDAVGLVLVGNGVDGIVSGLTSATNQPTDGPEAHAGGLVVLAGGVPALITDLISLLVAS